jgi:hypothetical protein
VNEPTITTYVEYFYPGSFYPETSAVAVTSREPERVAAEAPEAAFAFRFFDRASLTVSVGRKDVQLRSDRLNESGRYYIDAEDLTMADVAALPGDHKILLANMRSNGWEPVVRCRTGNFQPREAGDVLIRSTASHA